MRVLSPAILESHVGILGKTGSGKSNLAKVVVEDLLDAGERVCVIDPTGTWHGLRLTRARKPSPYQVVMFGGVHADIAIGPTHGAAIAETIATTSTSAVIDTRTMTVGGRTEFVAAFAETLLQRNRGILHLVVDEAHLFAPQGKVNDFKSGAMVHAANNAVSLGRGVGLRIILISQRPAKLHKDSLTQIETLVAMRLIAPQDRQAIRDWIDDAADRATGAEIIASLPSMATGDAWVWSPGENVLERIHAPLATTLDTGKASSDPVELGRIDLAAVRARLDEADITVAANDPKELRLKIARLEAQLAAVPPPVERTVEVPVEVRVPVEVPILADEHMDLLRALLAQEEAVGQAIQSLIDQTEVVHQKATGPVHFPPLTPRAAAPALRAVPPAVTRPERQREAPEDTGTPGTIQRAGRLILAALAGYPTALTREQLAFLCGYHPRAKSFTNSLGALRSAGYISPDFPASITPNGQAYRVAQGISANTVPLGGNALDLWLPRFGRPERAILEAANEVYPDSVDRATLASRAGYEHERSKGFTNALGRLRGLGLVDGLALSADFAALTRR